MPRRWSSSSATARATIDRLGARPTRPHGHGFEHAMRRKWEGNTTDIAWREMQTTRSSRASSLFNAGSPTGNIASTGADSRRALESGSWATNGP